MHQPSPTASPPPSPILLNAGPSPHGWHALESMLRCPQLYSYNHLLFPQGSAERREAHYDEENEPLLKGSLGHGGLAHHYAQARAKSLGQDPHRYYDPDEAIGLIAASLGEAATAFVPLAQETVQAYIDTYAIEDTTWKILEVEEVMSANITGHDGKAVPYTARADLVVEDATGRVWIIDHKFVSKITPRTHERYTLSGQFLGLELFGRARWKGSFAGVQVNLISWGTSPRYSRRRVESSPHALSGFAEVVSEAHALKERYRGLDPWFYPKALNEQVCIGPYGRCPGWEFCRFGRAAQGQQKR